MVDTSSGRKENPNKGKTNAYFGYATNSFSGLLYGFELAEIDPSTALSTVGQGIRLSQCQATFADGPF